jgi:hypothetical protein
MTAASNQFVHAKLIPISGNNDEADMDRAVTVQFNPTSLKVSLASTLSENARSGNSRSAQFVDKSSSNLTVELIFDTTMQGPEVQDSDGKKRPEWTESSDVRVLTGKIADRFMKTTGTGQNLRSPSRCSFLWGAFQFNGIMESFDETLDFFSPTGIPLRSTVALKLSESRYQFLSGSSAAAARDTPKLASTGNAGDDAAGDGGSVNDANKEAKKADKDWRNTALFNGIESPRLPNVAALAVPSMSVSASVSGSAAVSAGLGANLNLAAGGVASASPSFNFGASSTLGTNVAGAFSPASISSTTAATAGLSAGAIASGGAALRSGASGSIAGNASAGSGNGASANAGAQANSSVGFD